MSLKNATIKQLEKELERRKAPAGFTASDLSMLAYANNFTLWHYVTASPDVTVEGYFDKAKDMLRVNDLIVANIDTNSITPRNAFYVVTKSDGECVQVAKYE